MDWLSLNDEAGSDAVALLAVAELAEMKVTTFDNKLVIKGPRHAAAVARRLLANKSAVMTALGVYVYGISANAGENRNCVDVDSERTRDERGFPLEPGEELIDPSTLSACPRCNSLEKWWPAVGEPRCQKCDPPTAARRLLRHAQTIRIRLGMEARQPRAVPAEPHCPKCLATEFRDLPIHGGQSVRRDCAMCGRFVAFPIWCGEPSPISQKCIQIGQTDTSKDYTDAC
jgi:hypothetical protein